MRKSPVAAIGLLAALTLSLAACSSSSDGGSTPSASAPPAASALPSGTRVVEVEGQKVTIEGEAGAAPIMRFKSPLSITKQSVFPISKGTGDKAISDGQLLSVNRDLFSAQDGTEQSSTWQTDQPFGVIMSEASLGADMYNAFKGGKTYAQVLTAVPAAQTGSVPMLAYYEVESTQTLPAKAEGTKHTPPASLPQVTVAADGKPSITVPKGNPPTTEKVFTTIDGSGDYVDKGDTIAVQYTGWLWNGKQFDSSWERGAPFTLALGAGEVIKGWDEGLVKKTVGSQVLLVIPPDKGYGDKAQGEIPANSTLIFVVDILGKV